MFELSLLSVLTGGGGGHVEKRLNKSAVEKVMSSLGACATVLWGGIWETIWRYNTHPYTEFTTGVDSAQSFCAIKPV
jgi:hypothetical protein